MNDDPKPPVENVYLGVGRAIIPLRTTASRLLHPRGFEALSALGWSLARNTDKYLKSRKGRILTLDEVTNVEHIVAVPAFTIIQMAAIDTAYQSAF